MKKVLSLIVAVAFIATISLFSTNTLYISKNLASVPVVVTSDPPIVIYPPLKIQGTNSTPFIIETKTLPNSTTKSV